MQYASPLLTNVTEPMVAFVGAQQDQWSSDGEPDVPRHKPSTYG